MRDCYRRGLSNYIENHWKDAVHEQSCTLNNRRYCADSEAELYTKISESQLPPSLSSDVYTVSVVLDTVWKSAQSLYTLYHRLQHDPAGDEGKIYAPPDEAMLADYQHYISECSSYPLLSWADPQVGLMQMRPYVCWGSCASDPQAAHFSMRTIYIVITFIRAAAFFAVAALFALSVRSRFWRSFAVRRKMVARGLLSIGLALLYCTMVRAPSLTASQYFPMRLSVEKPNLAASAIKLGLLGLRMGAELPKLVPAEQKDLLTCTLAVGVDDAKQFYDDKQSQVGVLKPMPNFTRDEVLAEIKQQKSSHVECKNVPDAQLN